MARIIKTVSATGESSGGGGASGISNSDVCNLICSGIVGTASTNMLPKCQGQWQLICQCNQWNSSYTAPLSFDLDTANYRAFRWCWKGMIQKACCYHRFCAYFVNAGGTCTSSAGYRWFAMQNDKKWPVGSCCCWTYCQGDCICWCWYCCGSACSMPQSMTLTIGNATQKVNCMGNPNDTNAGQICFDFCTGGKYSACDYAYCVIGQNRIQGFAWCHPVTWNADVANANYALKSFKIQVDQDWAPTNEGSFSWQGMQGSCPLGYPCWSMYGIPCVGPTITGSNVQPTSYA